MKFHDKCDHLDHKLQEYKVQTSELTRKSHRTTLSVKQGLCRTVITIVVKVDLCSSFASVFFIVVPAC